MKNNIKIIACLVIIASITFLYCTRNVSINKPGNPKDTTANNLKNSTAKYVDNDNMALGNPSNASLSLDSTNNYLIVKPQYCLSYNNSKHIPNWTSWHLSSNDLGKIKRKNDFRPDTTLPKGWYEVTTTDYKSSGFDKGHMCNSADRTSNIDYNSATFLMDNMIPQSPKNNEVTWEKLEEYCRNLVKSNDELYIICGPYGQGGTGKNGFANKIKHDIVVPSETWKIVVVLPEGTNDLKRIDKNTRVIAVLMPNDQTCSDKPWYNYRVSVNQIETLTGYDFLSSVPKDIQKVIEAKVDAVAIK